MPRAKATDKGAESVEVKEKDPYAAVPSMIERMVKATSVDLNRHQIEASVYGRLEAWAEKQGHKDWMENMPRFVKVIREAAAARHERVQKYLEHKRLEHQKRLSEAELDA